MSVQKGVFVNGGDCKLSNRISKVFINFEELSLEFNIEQWSGMQVVFVTTKSDLASFGTFLIPPMG